MRRVEIRHEEKPVPWKRTQGSGRNRYMHPKYRVWRESFQWAAKQAMQGRTPFDEPLAVQVQVGADMILVTVSPNGREAVSIPAAVARPKGVRGDLDNYVKAVLDGMNGIVYGDDRVVLAVSAAFVDAPNLFDLEVPLGCSFGCCASDWAAIKEEEDE